MRGLDTNVIVRYVTAGDPAQTAVVKALFEGAEEAREQLFVSSIALCELVWTLRGRPYRLSRREIATVLERLLATHLFELQDRDLVRQALLEYRKGRGDFADYMLGSQNRRAGCESTLTFDRQLRGAAGFSLLA
jgi:predicted nucleic-acid-binding protein